MGEGGLDALRGIDFAVQHAPAQQLGRKVYQFDLLRAAGHLVGQGLPLRDTGDLPDHVAQGFQVLDVERGDDVDPRVQEFLDVLPSLGMA